MIIKASGRSALILAAGFFVLLTSPAMAADGDDSAADAGSKAPATLHKTFRHAWHHRRHYAHHSHHTIAKDDDDSKPAPTEPAAGANKVLAEIPPSVANANAQMLLAGVQISAAAAIPPGTDLPSAAPATASNETVVAAADQLSDSDRTLQESNSTAPATTAPPPAPAATIIAEKNMPPESSGWDQTSLIGKIFIGFGALLTMASAVRMFIA
jgi:hypothetical protein